MIYLLYGDDDFTRDETLSSMKDEFGPADLRDVNITLLEGSAVGFDELIAVSSTVPFLADKRMVIVKDLLSLFEARVPSRTGTRSTSPRERPQGPWETLPEHLSAVPETTELVFVEGRLNHSNPLLTKIRPIAKILAFPLPSGGELRQWIGQRAAKRGIDIEPRAVDTLAETIGRDLRVIDLELQKLSLYRWGETVRHGDVQELVSYAKEVNIFAAVDAVLEGRPGLGIRLINQLMDSGGAPSYLIAMMARQVRLLLLAKELRLQGVSPAEIGNRLSLSGYPLRKTLEQERRFTGQQLPQMHHKLLEADVSIKTRASDEQLVLDMLIADLASGG